MKLKWLRGAKYAKLNPVATPIISQRRLVEVAIKKLRKQLAPCVIALLLHGGLNIH
jgi:hypothetical protein